MEVFAEQTPEVGLGGSSGWAVVVREVEVSDAEVEGAVNHVALSLEGDVVTEVVPHAQRQCGQDEAGSPDGTVGHRVVAVLRGGVHRCLPGQANSGSLQLRSRGLFGCDVRLGGEVADAGGEFEVAVGHRTGVVAGQGDGDARVGEGDVRMMVGGLGCGADSVDEFEPGREVSRGVSGDDGLVLATPIGQPSCFEASVSVCPVYSVMVPC